MCRSGEIGRRTGFKIPRGQPRVGSIPTSGTTLSQGHYPWGEWACHPELIEGSAPERDILS